MLKNRNGITLVALVVTIIILLILAGISIASLTGSGLIGELQEAVNTTEKAEIEEEVKLAVMEMLIEENTNGKSNKEIFEEIKNILNLEGVTYKINEQTMNIITKDGDVYTLLADGTIIEGEVAYLDIADGSIELKSNGYKQGENTVEYTGKYIITGTTTENTVKITDVGTYDITIKDLNIDVSSIDNTNAFMAGNKNTGLNVIINIQGKNTLISKNASALSWSGIINDIEGSTLELCGTGELEVSCGNSRAAICIGGNNAKNIIINSATIYAVKKGEKYGVPIGGSNSSVIINRWKYIC